MFLEQSWLRGLLVPGGVQRCAWGDQWYQLHPCQGSGEGCSAVSELHARTKGTRRERRACRRVQGEEKGRR